MSVEVNSNRWIQGGIWPGVSVPSIAAGSSATLTLPIDFALDSTGMACVSVRGGYGYGSLIVRQCILETADSNKYSAITFRVHALSAFAASSDMSFNWMVIGRDGLYG